jgi:hypothetical protein
VVTLKLDQFFDPLDALYLKHLLKQKTEALGYQSDFACPVVIRLYFPDGKVPDKKALSEIIESRNLTYTEGDFSYNVALKFKVISISDEREMVSAEDYLKSMSFD